MAVTAVATYMMSSNPVDQLRGRCESSEPNYRQVDSIIDMQYLNAAVDKCDMQACLSLWKGQVLPANKLK